MDGDTLSIKKSKDKTIKSFTLKGRRFERCRIFWEDAIKKRGSSLEFRCSLESHIKGEAQGNWVVPITQIEGPIWKIWLRGNSEYDIVHHDRADKIN